MHLTPRLAATGLLAVVLLALAVGHWASNRSTAAPRVFATGQVVKVVDGDTINVQGAGPVRIIGIDAPETSDNDHAAVSGRCYGETAKKFLVGLIPPGTMVELVFDGPRTDRYGRTLAFVESDGYDVGAMLLERGYAMVATYKSKGVETPYKHSRLRQYLAVEEQAEGLELGIWGPTCAP